MSWFTLSTLSADGNTLNQESTTDAVTPNVLTWCGIENSIWDGYESTNNERRAIYSYDSSTAANKVEWGNKSKYWIRATIPSGKTFCLYYRWTENYPAGWPQYDHIHNFTVNFAPIAEEAEVAPETFKKFLEKCGEDETFLRMQHRMQKKMMKHTGQVPPWDPRKIKEMEQRRIELQERFGELQENEVSYLQERWGVDELPPLTAELLDSIRNRSHSFLESCLSPNEMLMYDKEGHIKIPSSRQENVYYIIKKGVHKMIERYVDDEHTENLCIVSKWRMIPHDDVIAGKVLDIKYNEEEMLQVANHFKKKRVAQPVIPLQLRAH